MLSALKLLLGYIITIWRHRHAALYLPSYSMDVQNILCYIILYYILLYYMILYYIIYILFDIILSYCRDVAPSTVMSVCAMACMLYMCRSPF